jgi:peptidoglycan/xylan/chitin deacetylase (PgdA/CDA1 family)
MATLMIGYDVEAHGNPAVTRAFLDAAFALHTELNAPCTLFLLGKVVEQNAEQLEPFVGHPLFDLQQHTYSHKLFKTVCMEDDSGKVTVYRGASLAEVEEDVARGRDVMIRLLGVDPIGVCGPYNYYRGLSDRPDILEVLHRHGIRFLRTYGRNERDYQPTPFSVQPFWYAPQGFPDMLELPIQGYQDYYLRWMVGWDDIHLYIQRLMRHVRAVAQRNLAWSYCQHDGSNRGDPQMTIIRALIGEARNLGMDVLSHRQFYDRALVSRQFA